MIQPLKTISSKKGARIRHASDCFTHRMAQTCTCYTGTDVSAAHIIWILGCMHIYIGIHMDIHMQVDA